jgi:hypothetical protein
MKPKYLRKTRHTRMHAIMRGYYTCRQAAKILLVCPSRVRQMVTLEHKLPYCKFGNQLFIRMDSVHLMLGEPELPPGPWNIYINRSVNSGKSA